MCIFPLFKQTANNSLVLISLNVLSVFKFKNTFYFLGFMFVAFF